jgi:hypothetical protein
VKQHAERLQRLRETTRKAERLIANAQTLVQEMSERMEASDSKAPTRARKTRRRRSKVSS